MLPITTVHYLVVAAALFGIGVSGVLTRRSPVIVLMSIELILNAVNLNLVAFSRMWGNPQGQVFAIFVTVAAASQAVVAVGVLIVLACGVVARGAARNREPSPNHASLPNGLPNGDAE
ncbi:MAG TPA: NADH-quinone oxidoreductase subunit NuoK [Terriglobales bacterium]|nr:NADH-quinone oxidoreductase subunit NuoK [Terriglobales bacterium]